MTPLAPSTSESPVDDPVQDAYPLAPLQQGLLFNALYAPGTGVDNVLLRYVLREELDPEALERAWRRLIEMANRIQRETTGDGKT